MMKSTINCPKCGFNSNTSFTVCPRCGVIVRKFLQKEEAWKEHKDRDAAEKKASLANLAGAHALIIRQKKEWGEILSGFETKNKYDVTDHWGNQLFQAEEEGGSFATIITRFLLTALRPFTLIVFSPEGQGLFKLKRPFRFFFHQLHVCKANDTLLGTIHRRFSIFRRIYSVLDQHGNEIFQLFGPILHPWTFQIRKGSQELGKITKKWSGVLKESFTDADNFGISFPQGIDPSQKAILLGAVFLIDFVHFESRGNRR